MRTGFPTCDMWFPLSTIDLVCQIKRCLNIASFHHVISSLLHASILQINWNRTYNLLWSIRPSLIAQSPRSILPSIRWLILPPINKAARWSSVVDQQPIWFDIPQWHHIIPLTRHLTALRSRYRLYNLNLQMLESALEVKVRSLYGPISVGWQRPLNPTVCSPSSRIQINPVHLSRTNLIRWSSRSNSYCASTLHFFALLFIWVFTVKIYCSTTTMLKDLCSLLLSLVFLLLIIHGLEVRHIFGSLVLKIITQFTRGYRILIILSFPYKALLLSLNDQLTYWIFFAHERS